MSRVAGWRLVQNPSWEERKRGSPKQVIASLIVMISFSKCRARQTIADPATLRPFSQAAGDGRIFGSEGAAAFVSHLSGEKDQAAE